MKKFNLLLILLLFGLLNAHAQWGRNTIKGSGKLATKTVNTSDYDVVQLNGSIDVELVIGNEGTIKISGDDNLIDYVEVKVNGDRLNIQTKDNFSYMTKRSLKVIVPVKSISEVSLNGSGDIYTDNRLVLKNIAINLQGSGDINMDLEAPIVRINLNGSGDIDLDVEAAVIDSKLRGSGDIVLTGSTDKLGVSVNGSGDFSGFRLATNDADVSVQGSGDAQVIAKEQIKAIAGGSGDVVYKGDPQIVDIKTSGSGDVRKYN